MIFVAGCSGGRDFMPLAQGVRWTYQVRSPALTQIMDVSVQKRVRVGLLQGWLLAGPGGASKFAWSGARLLVSEFAGFKFDPPLVILRPESETSRWSYSGNVGFGGTTVRAAAILIQKPAKLKIGEIEHTALLTSMNMKLSGRKVELRTWFERGEGIVGQEERIDGELIVALRIVSVTSRFSR